MGYITRSCLGKDNRQKQTMRTFDGIYLFISAATLRSPGEQLQKSSTYRDKWKKKLNKTLDICLKYLAMQFYISLKCVLLLQILIPTVTVNLNWSTAPSFWGEKITKPRSSPQVKTGQGEMCSPPYTGSHPFLSPHKGNSFKTHAQIPSL